MEGSATDASAPAPPEAAPATPAVDAKKPHVGKDATNKCVYLSKELARRATDAVARLKSEHPTEEWSFSKLASVALEAYLARIDGPEPSLVGPS